MKENKIDNLKRIFSLEDMEKCFIAGQDFAKNIDNPTMGEYLLPLYKHLILELFGENPKPSGFESYLSNYKPVLQDAFSGEIVAYGFDIIERMSEDMFEKLRAFGEVKYIGVGKKGSYALIIKKLTREEAIKKYGEITNEKFGPRGGWKHVTFGKTQFCNDYLRPAKETTKSFS